LKIVPFSDVYQMWKEYKSFFNRSLTNELAQETTFREAFKECDNIRLLGCKGGFQTCEICNTAYELLRDPGTILFISNIYI
jgi:hypothetical protein